MTTDWTLLGRKAGLPAILRRESAAAAVQHAFPLLERDGSFRAFRDHITTALERNGVAIVGDAPVDDDGALTALVCAAGMPTAQGNGVYPALIHEVVPTAFNELSDTTKPVGLHTDSSWLPRPHRILVLACRSADRGGGGQSLIARGEDVIARLDADCVAALRDPVFPFPVTAADGRKTVERWPILTVNGNATAIRYRRDLIRCGIARTGAPLSPVHRKAFDAFGSALAGADDLVERFSLQAGDVLFIDNHRSLHGRTALEPGGGRHLRRMKLNQPASASGPRETAADRRQ